MKHLSLLFAIGFTLPAFSQDVITTKVWDHRYGGSGFEILWDLAACMDGGYLMGGQSNSDSSGDRTQHTRGYIDYWVVKTDAMGVKQWDYRYGGSSANGASDILKSIYPTNDSGFVLVGASNSGMGSASTSDKSEPHFGNISNAWMDYWVIKINKNGVKQWDHVYGGIEEDYLNTICATKSGGYITGGYSNSGISGNKSKANKGGTDFYIIKFSANGFKEWDQVYGGTADDELRTILATEDGGYLLGGPSLSGIGADKSQSNRGQEDYWVVKIDSLGTKQWDARFGGPQSDLLQCVKATGDGGYLLAGYTQSGAGGDKTQGSRGGFADGWVVKINANGIKQWDYTFGSNGEDGIATIMPEDNGSFLLGGTVGGSGGDASQNSKGWMDYWLLQIDSSGAKQWDKRFGGSGLDQLIAIEKIAPGTYVLGGSSESGPDGDKTESNRGIRDYWMIKIKTDPRIMIDNIANRCGTATSWIKFNESSVTDTLNFAYSDNNFSDVIPAGTKTVTQNGWDSIAVQWPLQPSGNNYRLRVISVNPPDTVYSNAFVFNPVPAASISTTGNLAFCSGDSVLLTASPSGADYTFSWTNNGTLLSDDQAALFVKHGGTYQLTVTAKTGCKGISAPLNIPEKARPAKPSITQLSGFVLQSTPASGYQWFLDNGPIPGAINQTLNIAQNGSYRVKADSTNECSNMSNPYTVTSVGMASYSVYDDHKMYPNPADERLVIEVAEPANAVFTLTDLNGKVITSCKLENKLTEIDTHNIPNGVYVYRFGTDSNTRIGKIIIAHPI